MEKFCKVLPYKFNSFSSFYEKLEIILENSNKFHGDLNHQSVLNLILLFGMGQTLQF